MLKNLIRFKSDFFKKNASLSHNLGFNSHGASKRHVVIHFFHHPKQLVEFIKKIGRMK